MWPFIGPIPAHVLGWLLAIILGGGAAAWLMARAGMSDDAIVWSLLPRIAAVFVGSKLLYLVEDWQRWWGDLGTFLTALFSAQMRVPGGVLLLLIVGQISSRWLGVRGLFLSDTIAPAAGLMIVGIRVGCFLEGCCHGYPTALPWGVHFPPMSPAAMWQMRHGMIERSAGPVATHPLQLYFALAGLLIFVGLAAYQRRKRYEGEVLLLLVLAYLWSTWMLEFARAQAHAVTHQSVLAAALGATVLGAMAEWRHRMSLGGGRPAHPVADSAESGRR